MGRGQQEESPHVEATGSERVARLGNRSGWDLYGWVSLLNPEHPASEQLEAT